MKKKIIIRFIPLKMMGILLMFLSISSRIIAQESGATIKDIDGNVYKTVIIGTQTWMAENLKTTKYNDGTAIPLVTSNIKWRKLLTPGYCWYENDSIMKPFGALYNGHALDSSKLCPQGWHPATIVDWTILKKYLVDNGYGYGGSGDDIAKSMAYPKSWAVVTVVDMSKIDSLRGQIGFSRVGNNTSGFSALAGGGRAVNGYFTDYSFSGYWWCYMKRPFYTREIVIQLWCMSSVLEVLEASKKSGFSVRCVKD